MLPQKNRFIDIAVNLTDCVFRGIDWKGKTIHEDDFDGILERARTVGVEKVIVSGTNLEQCKRAVALCKKHPGFLYCTVGVHPAHCAEFLRPLEASELLADSDVPHNQVTIHGPKGMPAERSPELEEEHVRIRFAELRRLIDEHRDVVVAVGEIGLDGAEVAYCPMDVQKVFFERQLMELARPVGLPLFLHSRECGMEFARILGDFHNVSNHIPGVVHSFNGSDDEMTTLLDMGFYLGINASAFRSEAVATQVVKIPVDRLMIETDAPWCDARKTDFGFPFINTHFPTAKRGSKTLGGKCLERRCEPCHIIHVLEMYRQVAANNEEKLADVLFNNAERLFFSGSDGS